MADAGSSLSVLLRGKAAVGRAGREKEGTRERICDLSKQAKAL